MSRGSCRSGRPPGIRNGRRPLFREGESLRNPVLIRDLSYRFDPMAATVRVARTPGVVEQVLHPDPRHRKR